jgi:transposase
MAACSFVRTSRRADEPHETCCSLNLPRASATRSSCGVRVVESFAVSLDQDGAAVRASLRLPWSSGQDEGQINRLKLLKRSMYGRAKLDLLRRRFLLKA